MVNLDSCADRRLRIREVAGEGSNCRFFTKRNDPRCAEHVDVATPERYGRVPFTDHQRCLPDEPLRDVHGVSLQHDHMEVVHRITAFEGPMRLHNFHVIFAKRSPSHYPTRISPRSDQSFWSKDTLTIFGVVTRCGGNDGGNARRPNKPIPSS